MTTEALDDVTAIVVTHDSAGVLEECLAALRSEGVRVIVVDNASEDDTVAIAERHGARVVRAPFNEGYGRANNRGIAAAAGARWCLIVNPDVIVEPNAVRRLREIGDSDPRIGMVVPQIIEPDGRIFTHETSLLSPVSPPRQASGTTAAGGSAAQEIAFASGACMLVRRDAFVQLGGFDSNIFLFYEDDDLCLRLRRTGQAIVKAAKVSVRHGRGKSSVYKPGRVYAMRYHQAWSRCYVAKKHGVRPRTARFAAIQSLKLAAALLTLNRSRVERYRGSLGGVIAAVRGRRAFQDADAGGPATLRTNV